MNSINGNGRLPYADANATPWPLNHHAYVHACADLLAKELMYPPRVHLPETHMQDEEYRRAAVVVPLEHRSPLFLSWDEGHGWTSVESAGQWPLALGAEPVLSPALFTEAVFTLLAPGRGRMALVRERHRDRVHPADHHFERRLASFRSPDGPTGGEGVVPVPQQWVGTPRYSGEPL